MSKLLKYLVKDDEDKTIGIPSIYEGKLCRRAFEFCEMYSRKPYADITHPLDDQMELHNFYNEFLYNLTPNSVISLLLLSDFLDIPPLNKLICFHLAYLIRNMGSKQRLKYFNICDPIVLQSAEM